MMLLLKCRKVDAPDEQKFWLDDLEGVQLKNPPTSTPTEVRGYKLLHNKQQQNSHHDEMKKFSVYLHSVIFCHLRQLARS